MHGPIATGSTDLEVPVLRYVEQNALLHYINRPYWTRMQATGNQAKKHWLMDKLSPKNRNTITCVPSCTLKSQDLYYSLQDVLHVGMTPHSSYLCWISAALHVRPKDWGEWETKMLSLPRCLQMPPDIKNNIKNGYFVNYFAKISLRLHSTIFCSALG